MLDVASALAAWLAQWPQWATASCATLLGVLVALHAADRVFARSQKRLPLSAAAATTASDSTSTNDDDSAGAFTSFRRQYLTVYFLVMFADWLQGTHMYSLYQARPRIVSYGVNVSALFLTGFLSSALFGNFVGPIVDRYGRRNACLVYCALEIAINLLENVPSMSLLLVGRVLGGVSTSLLFSAFESWMVTEHRARGFAEELLPSTFAIASEGNGVLAVFAGFAAQAAADAVGEIGPFRLAVVVTALAAAFVLGWTENYGASTSGGMSATNAPVAASSSVTRLSHEAIALGLCYSLFDGAMYVFVFLWYPTLEAVVPSRVLPSGLVFSSFMLCIAIGGKLFDQISASVRSERLVCVLSAVSVVALLVPTLSQSYMVILCAFFAFEIAVGMFAPCCGALRSRYFPAEGLSATLGLFRLPTNVLVVLGTGGANYLSHDALFCGCSTVLALSTVCGLQLLSTSASVAATAQRVPTTQQSEKKTD